MNFVNNPRINYLVIFLAIALSSCYNSSHIQEIDSIKQAQAKLQAADSHTLVIFDVDDTLTYNPNVQHQEWYKSSEHGKKRFEEILAHIHAQENPEEYEEKITAGNFKKVTRPVLEPAIIPIINTLKNNGAKIIALTRIHTGPLADIPSLPKWRYEKLREVGIDFSASFPQENIVLEQLTSKAMRHPEFYKGILVTDKCEKGEVLGAFLDIIKWQPKEVIFIDDTPKFVKSVQDEMKKRGIPFQGYIYKAIDKLPKVYDQDVLDYQVQHLKKFDEQISDEEARTLMHKHPKTQELINTQS